MPHLTAPIAGTRERREVLVTIDITFTDSAQLRAEKESLAAKLSEYTTYGGTPLTIPLLKDLGDAGLLSSEEMALYDELHRIESLLGEK